MEWTQERRERLKEDLRLASVRADGLADCYYDDLEAVISEIDRLTARVEALNELTEVYRIALTSIANLGVNGVDAGDAAHAVVVAEDALRWSPHEPS